MGWLILGFSYYHLWYTWKKMCLETWEYRTNMTGWKMSHLTIVKYIDSFMAAVSSQPWKRGFGLFSSPMETSSSPRPPADGSWFQHKTVRTRQVFAVRHRLALNKTFSAVSGMTRQSPLLETCKIGISRQARQDIFGDKWKLDCLGEVSAFSGRWLIKKGRLSSFSPTSKKVMIWIRIIYAPQMMSWTKWQKNKELGVFNHHAPFHSIKIHPLLMGNGRFKTKHPQFHQKQYFFEVSETPVKWHSHGVVVLTALFANIFHCLWPLVVHHLGAS